jgi:hypothetical protein
VIRSRACRESAPDAVPHQVQYPSGEAVPLTGPAGGGAQLRVVLMQCSLLEDLSVPGDHLGAAALVEQQTADQETVKQCMIEIASMDSLNDGAEYLTITATTSAIRDSLHASAQVTMTAQPASAYIKLRLGIDFGDPVPPAP